MPELPDLTVYAEHISRRTIGKVLKRIRIRGPFLLRSVDPPIGEVEGKTVRSVRRLGKRIILGLEDELFVVLHLMIAGRFHWKPPGTPIPNKIGLGGFDFDHGVLLLTEATTKKRASLHLVRGKPALAGFNRGGLEVLESDEASFRACLALENHTLKRALTDPKLFSGIGNAYSDEILYHARLSPFLQTKKMGEAEAHRLFQATGLVLREWTDRLRAGAGDEFPESVTAFREGMAVHGRYRKPCSICGAPIQRIIYAEQECFYCPGCQTDGRILADRVLSRLLKNDWPKTIEELENMPGLAAEKGIA